MMIMVRCMAFEEGLCSFYRLQVDLSYFRYLKILGYCFWIGLGHSIIMIESVVKVYFDQS